MVSSSKSSQALYALHGVLIKLRFWALTGRSQRDIAEVLDMIEELPRLLASPDDRTQDVERSLNHLKNRYPDFGTGAERWLEDEAPEAW